MEAPNAAVQNTINESILALLLLLLCNTLNGLPPSAVSTVIVDGVVWYVFNKIDNLDMIYKPFQAALKRVSSAFTTVNKGLVQNRDGFVRVIRVKHVNDVNFLHFGVKLLQGQVCIKGKDIENKSREFAAICGDRIEVYRATVQAMVVDLAQQRAVAQERNDEPMNQNNGNDDDDAPNGAPSVQDDSLHSSATFNSDSTAATAGFQVGIENNPVPQATFDTPTNKRVVCVTPSTSGVSSVDIVSLTNHQDTPPFLMLADPQVDQTGAGPYVGTGNNVSGVPAVHDSAQGITQSQPHVAPFVLCGKHRPEEYPFHVPTMTMQDTHNHSHEHQQEVEEEQYLLYDPQLPVDEDYGTRAFKDVFDGVHISSCGHEFRDVDHGGEMVWW